MAKDNHHFVPQGYLRGFTIEGEKSLVWEYDKEAGSVSHQPKSVREICSKHHYYMQKCEDGSVDNESMENAFHEIEDKTPRVINSIKVNTTGEKISLSNEQRDILSFFAALQLFRVPNFRDGVEELHRKIAECSLANIVTRDKQEGKLPPDVEEIYVRGGIKIEIEPFVSLEPMINLAREGSARLLTKVWHFASPADGMTFVTSDNPVYFQAPEEYRPNIGYGIGPMHPLSEVTIPLRKDLLLIFTPAVKYTPAQYELLNCTTVCLDKTDTENLNKRTILAAGRYVYSSERSEALAKMVSMFKGTSQKLTV